MSLDIKVNRPPGKRAPGPEDRDRLVPAAPAGDSKSAVPKPVPPVAPPPPSVQSTSLPPVKKKGKIGKWLWWFLLIILFAALLVLIYVIWGGSKGEEEIVNDASPVVSTFTPPVQPPPTLPTPPAEEEILSLSILGAQLGDLNEKFNEVNAENNEQITSSDKIITWRLLVGDYMALHEKYLQYYSNLELKMFANENSEVLAGYLEDISNKLDQAKIELDIAAFALAGNERQEVAIDSITEVIASLQNAVNSLSAATDSISLLEQELALQDNQLDADNTTTTPTSTMETVTSTEKITTSTATTTP